MIFSGEDSLILWITNKSLSEIMWMHVFGTRLSFPGTPQDYSVRIFPITWRDLSLTDGADEPDRTAGYFTVAQQKT